VKKVKCSDFIQDTYLLLLLLYNIYYLLNLFYFLYRDLAARNILINNGWEAKVSDFGLSKIIKTDKDNSSRSEVGPLKRMSPLNFFYIFKIILFF